MGRVGATNEVEGTNLQGAGEAIDDVDGLLASQGLLQQLTGIVNTTSGDEVLGGHQILEFLQNRILQLGINIVQAGNLKGQCLDLILTQMLEDVGGNLGSQ